MIASILVLRNYSVSPSCSVQSSVSTLNLQLFNFFNSSTSPTLNLFNSFNPFNSSTASTSSTLPHYTSSINLVFLARCIQMMIPTSTSAMGGRIIMLLFM
jgi:hypothetical protein